MPIDWDKFSANLDGLAKQAETRTDEQLASQISSVTRLTDEEVRAMFPDPSDVQKLGELISIVKQADARNDSVNKLVNGIEEFGGIVVKLLQKFL